MSNVACEGEVRVVAVGEHFRPLSRVVLCAGTLGGGAGGFSRELLNGASEEVLRTLFDALMQDVRSGVVSPDWKRVLYVLLNKPGNDNRLASKRRDIALMSQEMKLLLQMVRRVCYTRVARRVLHDQVGWVSGHGAFDPAVSAAIVMQQRHGRRRLGRRRLRWWGEGSGDRARRRQRLGRQRHGQHSTGGDGTGVVVVALLPMG